jgi:hypothetical protein
MPAQLQQPGQPTTKLLTSFDKGGPLWYYLELVADPELLPPQKAAKQALTSRLLIHSEHMQRPKYSVLFLLGPTSICISPYRSPQAINNIVPLSLLKKHIYDMTLDESKGGARDYTANTCLHLVDETKLLKLRRISAADANRAPKPSTTSSLSASKPFVTVTHAISSWMLSVCRAPSC